MGKLKNITAIGFAIGAVLILVLIWVSVLSPENASEPSNPSENTKASAIDAFWPEHGGSPQRVNQAPDLDSELFKLKWVVKIKDLATAPIVVGGKIWFTIGGYRVLALDPATGDVEQKWEIVQDFPVSTHIALTTPPLRYEDGIIYNSLPFGKREVALPLTEMKNNASQVTNKEATPLSSYHAEPKYPDASNDKYALSTDGKIAVYADREGTLIFSNVTDGARLLAYQTYSSVQSNPAVRENIAYFTTLGGTVFAFSIRSGQLIWSTSLGDIINADSAVSSKYLLIPTYSGKLHLLERGSGKITGELNFDAPLNSPLFLGENRALTCTSNGVIELITIPDMKSIWQYETESTLTDSLTPLPDGFVAIDNEGNIYRFETIK